MTDTIEQPTELLDGRKLTNALTLLVSDMADAIDARFQSDGNPESKSHAANYLAHGSAYRALHTFLIATPADQAFRMELLGFLMQAWALTQGRPEVDEHVRVVIDRASRDYKPETPDELKKKKADKKPAGPKAGPK